MTNRTTRLAPSPTGALHLGNARTFLITWAIARQDNWNLLMRVEDIDGPRVKAHAADEAIDTLRWLGIDFDGEILHQSHDLEPYRHAMRKLAAMRMVFPCALTRTEVEAASSAPHEGENELRYPPELRPAAIHPDCFDDDATNYRLLVEDETIIIHDEFLGQSQHNPHQEIGDFVIWTKRAMPAYQLAVVVDDARQGVTDVIRGADLLPSAARQALLYRALGLAPPRWWHLPLVLGADGRRLAKRHGDTRISAYRKQGVRPERIIGLIAAWSGAGQRPGQSPYLATSGPSAREEMSASEFRDCFDLRTLPRTPIVFTEPDHQWLLKETR
jgi:glutamyl-tRNA synthetase